MTQKACRAFDDMIPRAFQRRSRYDFRTYDMGCKKVYDFPSCEKRYTLECGDVLKALLLLFFLFFFFCFVFFFVFCCCCSSVVLLLLLCFLKKRKEVSVFRNTHAK